jgi:hypothetical protein
MRHHLTHLRAMDLLMAFLSVISVCSGLRPLVGSQ